MIAIIKTENDDNDGRHHNHDNNISTTEINVILHYWIIFSTAG